MCVPLPTTQGLLLFVEPVRRVKHSHENSPVPLSFLRTHSRKEGFHAPRRSEEQVEAVAISRWKIMVARSRVVAIVIVGDDQILVFYKYADKISG